MAQKIIRLEEAIINQIAAGEVVENPASVAKELIENSMDAGATRLIIRIESGGYSLLEVEDDGCGMGAEDALLCLERHATSKIRCAEDLQALRTMGFRGEALAAIAAVSHLAMTTSEGGIGTRLCAEGGVAHAISPFARNRGTTVSVRSLFFNVPARKKFQKSAATSQGQIVKVVEMVAMAHPEVDFMLYTPKETLCELYAEPLKQRIERILSPFAHEVHHAMLRGFLGAPSAAKNHRREQYLFLNRRPIFSPLIARAVQVGYGTRLSVHQYPAFVLFLEIDPKEVDVNVHPQKRQVRLSQENVLFHLVETAIAEVFSQPGFSTAVTFQPPPSFHLSEEPFAMPFVAEPLDLPLEIPTRPLSVVEGYLWVEQNGIILVDLRGAQARVLFEQLQQPATVSQSLLWPLEMPLEEEEDIAGLTAMGVVCRLLGPKQLVIDALPEGLEASHFSTFFSAWKEGRRYDRAAVCYCRSLKKVYPLEEAFALWRHLQTCQDPLYDPLGKPIWKKIQRSDLEQWMMRG